MKSRVEKMKRTWLDVVLDFVEDILTRYRCKKGRNGVQPRNLARAQILRGGGGKVTRELPNGTLKVLAFQETCALHGWTQKGEVDG